MSDSVDGIRKRGRQGGCPIPIALKQVKCNPLCRFLTYARHAPECIDHSNK
jgi:hypothetical protein